MTKIIKPDKAITPSITKTLKKQMMIKSDIIIEITCIDIIERIKNVIISNNNKVISSHSETIKNNTHKDSQISNT